MDQAQKARDFAALHVPGEPLVLYNVWDAGGAKIGVEAGAKAIATASWAVAAAHGYDDGETVPFDLALTVLERITATVALPVTLDFEGGYAVEPTALATNVGRVIAAGAIGINFEDQIVGGDGLHGIDTQCARIAALREAADAAGVGLFINARTDLFLKEKDAAKHPAHLAEAKERGAAYAEAGASGFFVPALNDPDLIARVCAASRLPVNAIMLPGSPDTRRLAELGVARISYGPVAYREAAATFAERYRTALDA
ncbi:MAG: isocitrate lyase/phosphoenolpyruvate mutase family protein [Pseudomonadota bacterium]